MATFIPRVFTRKIETTQGTALTALTAQVAEPQKNENNLESELTALTAQATSTQSDRTPPLICVGSIVSKRHNSGWVGIVQAIEEQHVRVLWSLEKHPDRIRTEDLRLSQYASKWQNYFSEEAA